MFLRLRMHLLEISTPPRLSTAFPDAINLGYDIQLLKLLIVFLLTGFRPAYKYCSGTNLKIETICHNTVIVVFLQTTVLFEPYPYTVILVIHIIFLCFCFLVSGCITSMHTCILCGFVSLVLCQCFMRCGCVKPGTVRIKTVFLPAWGLIIGSCVDNTIHNVIKAYVMR